MTINTDDSYIKVTYLNKHYLLFSNKYLNNMDITTMGGSLSEVILFFSTNCYFYSMNYRKIFTFMEFLQHITNENSKNKSHNNSFTAQ